MKKTWIVEYSYPCYGGGRAYATMTIMAEAEADARVECLRKDWTNVPLHVWESKPVKNEEDDRLEKRA